MTDKISKISELLEITEDFSDWLRIARDSPIEMGIRYGCDCGCGGDAYTDEEWDEEAAILRKAEGKMEVLMQTLSEGLDLEIDITIGDLV